MSTQQMKIEFVSPFGQYDGTVYTTPGHVHKNRCHIFISSGRLYQLTLPITMVSAMKYYCCLVQVVP